MLQLFAKNILFYQVQSFMLYVVHITYSIFVDQYQMKSIMKSYSLA